MKNNQYYHVTFQRNNVIKTFLVTVFVALASWPRLLIEVFLRKHFGKRYFSLPTAIIIALLLGAAPYARSFFASYGGASFITTVGENFTWYLFLAAFLFFAFKRHKETQRLPDFHFSLSTGVIDPRFYAIDVLNIIPNPRNIAIIFEPGLFLIAGIILAVLQQNIGYVIIVSSVMYSLGYVGTYYLGDQFVMDKIDEMITNEELVNSFVHNRKADQTKGFEFIGKQPANLELRRKLANTFVENDPAVEAF